MISLRGLTTKFRNELQRTGVLSLVKLRPEDVTLEIPGDDPEIDWEHVLYIKNCREYTKDGGTIVWTATGGFFHTQLSALKVINLRANTGVVCWLDMRAYRELIERKMHQKLTMLPYVLGALRLVPIGNRKGNQYSWLNCTTINTINRTAYETRSEVMLDDGLGEGLMLEVGERPGTLKKKAMYATYIYRNEQQHLGLIQSQHRAGYAGIPYRDQAEVRAALHGLHIERDVLLVHLAFDNVDYQMPANQLHKLVVMIRQNSRLN
ncbi:hypothetical protein [Levilactobacillus namurensis]|uniref:Uncharacterized protein n=1 Tax=Levilactobacillus namurensis TaxID=380393 RepID=A0AAW8W4K2_9LACO|nr:hypothetical protein [Levilactobacillus namurensis]MDT7013673.1 hypothetical protein [Levilactobacillus namurensis]